MAHTPRRLSTAAVDIGGMEQPTPRPRGRPKKTTNTVEQPPAHCPKKKVHHCSKQTREAARLQREAQLENDADPEEATSSKRPPTAPRSRGRPKKQIVADASSREEVARDSSQKGLITAATITAAKDHLSAEIYGLLADGSAEEQSTSTSYRGRGHPKKTQAVETEEVGFNEQAPGVEDTHEILTAANDTLGGNSNTSNIINVPVKRELQEAARRLATARKTISTVSAAKNSASTFNKPAADKSLTKIATSALLSSLVGDYNVSYTVVVDKIHPGRLTIKFATDGGENMLAGSIELGRWSGVMRLALTEQKIRQYILKQERIEREGLALFDMMYLDNQDDEESEAFLLANRNPAYIKGKEVAATSLDNDTAISHKPRASNDIVVDIPSKHRKVSQSSSSELRTLYSACRIKNICTEEVEHKAQTGTIQFYTRNGEMAFGNTMISAPGGEPCELSGQVMEDKGPEWPS
ncbi:hypothetical protein QBC36DRAFT_313735 [Triangularia setosa]|uniref:Uncharacterized protein n=1 Tax=Triangularia setosa TaxID=2587417 RepID=A0AAN6W289_9PEZI|nr:hypothetical protein QBC36DRAFT_313735 [Podospora setosa]